MLTNGVKQRIELAHEPGQWIEIQPLSWRIHQEARQLRTAQRFRDSIRSVAELGEDFATARELTEGQGGDAARDVEDEYEVAKLLHASIVGWSYDAEVTPANIDSLDQQTVDVVLDALLPRRTEAARKNGTGPSTERSTAKGQRQKTG